MAKKRTKTVYLTSNNLKSSLGPDPQSKGKVAAEEVTDCLQEPATDGAAGRL